MCAYLSKHIFFRQFDEIRTNIVLDREQILVELRTVPILDVKLHEHYGITGMEFQVKGYKIRKIFA